MSDENSFKEVPAYVERSSKKSKVLVVFFIVLLIFIVVLGGLYYFYSTSGKKLFSGTPTPTPTKMAPTSTPPISPSASLTATPSGKLTPGVSVTPGQTSQFDRSKLTVTILNGSGIAGAAKGVASSLSGLGYTIKTTGNADTFDYTGYTVKVAKKNSASLAQIKKDVQAYAKSSTVTASVDDTITTDIEVIVGK